MNLRGYCSCSYIYVYVLEYTGNELLDKEISSTFCVGSPFQLSSIFFKKNWIIIPTIKDLLISNLLNFSFDLTFYQAKIKLTISCKYNIHLMKCKSTPNP